MRSNPTEFCDNSEIHLCNEGQYLQRCVFLKMGVDLMSRYHLGINLGHDRSAAIIRDGEIIAAIHQERLDRRKNSIGLLLQAIDASSQTQLPDEAIQYCLKSCGIGLLDVASITANMPGIDHSADILRRNLPSELGSRVLEIPSHHLAQILMGSGLRYCT